MAGRRRGLHPSIWAAIITAAASIIIAVVTIMAARQGAPSPRSSRGGVASPTQRLKTIYEYSSGHDHLQFRFSEGRWSMSAAGAWRGSMGGTYRFDAGRATLLIGSSSQDMARFASPLHMTLDSDGMLHLDEDPKWTLAPRR